MVFVIVSAHGVIMMCGKYFNKSGTDLKEDKKKTFWTDLFEGAV